MNSRFSIIFKTFFIVSLLSLVSAQVVGKRSADFTRTQSWTYSQNGKTYLIELSYGGPNFKTPKKATVKENGKIIRTFTKIEDFKKEDQDNYSQLYEKFAGLKLLPVRVNRALEILKKYDPFGYSVYKLLEDKHSFDGYIQGGDHHINEITPVPNTIDTAIHESLHAVDSQKSRGSMYYYQLDKSFIHLKAIHGLPQRKVVYRYLNEEDKQDSDLMSKAKTYLTDFSGTMPFELLLEELNAYTIGANTMYNLLTSEGSPYTNLRYDYPGGAYSYYKVNPGIIHFLRFNSLYVHHLKLKDKRAFHKMRNNKAYTATMLKLWRQAEMVLNKVCARKKDLLYETDLKTLQRTYNDASIESMRHLFNKKEDFSIPQNCQ